MAKEVVRVGSETAEVQFYDPASENHRRIKFDSVPMWRGDHRKCNHAGGTCVAPRGWILDGRTWELKPHVVPISIEERAMGTIVYRGQKGRYPESVHTAKGMVAWSDDLSRVKPSEQVKQHLIDRALRVYQTDLERKGAKFGEVREMLKERTEELRSANGLNPPTRGKRAEP